MNRIQIFENGINVVFEITDDKEVKLLHFSALPFDENNIASNAGYDLVELRVDGKNTRGCKLRFKEIKDLNNSFGRKLEITCFDDVKGFETVSHIQFYTGTQVARVWTEVNNRGTVKCTLEQISSFILAGIDKEGILPQDEKMRVGLCHGTYFEKLQWQFFPPDEVGHRQANDHIRMGYIENTETASALMWQSEHRYSLPLELTENEGHLRLVLSGKTRKFEQSFWGTDPQLAPGESFISSCCSVCAVKGGFDEAVGEMTKYRRIVRRKSLDNKLLPVIFEDSISFLWEDDTTEIGLLMIDAAAEAGCEYYCTYPETFDHRLHDSGELRVITDYIRKKGMRAGAKLSVHVDAIDELVRKCGVGYIKLDEDLCDENDNGCISQLDDVLARHKGLITGDCYCCGIRTICIPMFDSPTEVVTMASVVCPENAEIWCRPTIMGFSENAVFNMVGAMLLRIHLNDMLVMLADEARDIIKEGIAVYKRIRSDIKDALPFFPLGVPQKTDSWTALGLDCGKRKYLAVWRLCGGDKHCVIPLKCCSAEEYSISCIYPSFNEEKFGYDPNDRTILVEFRCYQTARLFMLEELP